MDWKKHFVARAGSCQPPTSTTVYIAAIWTGKINKLIFMLILIQECQNDITKKNTKSSNLKYIFVKISISTIEYLE
jgi:hypothetical protein